MRVLLRTNLDAYQMVVWPVLDSVPRKGEIVYVHLDSFGYCDHKKIPRRLEVSQVYYHHDRVEVDLWYNETDYKLWTPEHLSKIH